MPSAEETTYLIEVMPDTNSLNQDFGSRDVDVLVSRIKENLRLTTRSRLKSRSSLAHNVRPSPYGLQPSSRSWYESDVCELCSVLMTNSLGEESSQKQQQQWRRRRLCHAKHCRQRTRQRRELDDYERLKVLLKKGALIKEAVKRLHVEAVEDSYTSEDERSRKGATTGDNSEDELSSVAGDDFYRRKHFDYDDEDEPLYHNIYLGELD